MGQTTLTVDDLQFAEEEDGLPCNQTTTLYDTFEVEVLADGLHWQTRTDEMFQQSVLERLRKEACEVYKLARTVWTHEAKVVKLQDLFVKR
ncbi:MAG: hypothetical protein JO125_07035 [Chloroflexi bacterium]|nr:hypothetical protein [Ktedonobacteraceae bacterium]MBV9707146.1 hypothetical protein [Chloroflexota bacterium]